MRFLITGLSGFVGRHLAALLLARGDEVYGTVHRPTSREQLRDLAARFAALRDECVYTVDVADRQAMTDIVASVQPDGVLHLAGVTSVGESHADPAAAVRTNVLGSLSVFSAVRERRPSCRVLAIGSADAYGLVGSEDLPVRETCHFQPLSPYGASKAAMDLIAYQWVRAYQVDIVRMRPFNHTGAGQRAGFVCPDFARQLVAIERGQQAPTIFVGNTEVVRDFSDVRDIAAAYVAAWTHGQSGAAYNVCSGVGRSIREVLDSLIDIAAIRVDISVAADRVRQSDVPIVIGSAEKLQAATGWTPRHEWRETLATVLADWRHKR